MDYPGEYSIHHHDSSLWVAIVALIIAIIIMILVIYLYVERDKIIPRGVPLAPKIATAITGSDTFDTNQYNAYIGAAGIQGTPLTATEAGDLTFTGTPEAATKFTVQVTKSGHNTKGRVLYFHNRSKPRRDAIGTVFPPQTITGIPGVSNVFLKIEGTTTDISIPPNLLVDPGGSLALVAQDLNNFVVLSASAPPSLPYILYN